MSDPRIAWSVWIANWTIKVLLAISTLVAIPLFYFQHHRAIADQAELQAAATNQAISDLIELQRRLETGRTVGGSGPDKADARKAALAREFLVLRGRDGLVPGSRVCLFLLFGRMEQAEAGTLPPGTGPDGAPLTPAELIEAQAATLKEAVADWIRPRNGPINVLGRFETPLADRVFEACAQETAPDHDPGGRG